MVYSSWRFEGTNKRIKTYTQKARKNFLRAFINACSPMNCNNQNYCPNDKKHYAEY